MWLWRAPTTYDYAIQASVRPPNGAWEAPSTVRDVPADGSAYQVSLASGPAGSLMAMWAESDAADLTTTYAVIEDPAAPDTGKIKGPKQIKPTKKGTFTFTGPAGATYECRVDKTRKQQDGPKETAGKKPVPWKACKSPYKVKAKKLKLGKHTVYVRAVQFRCRRPQPVEAEVQGAVMSRRLLVAAIGAALTLTGLTGLTSAPAHAATWPLRSWWPRPRTTSTTGGTPTWSSGPTAPPWPPGMPQATTSTTPSPWSSARPGGSWGAVETGCHRRPGPTRTWPSVTTGRWRWSSRRSLRASSSSTPPSTPPPAAGCHRWSCPTPRRPRPPRTSQWAPAW